MVERSRPALNVVRGLIYGDRSQLFNRRLVPSYQTFFRWMGARADAEDATRWLFEAVVAALELPAPVEEVNGRLSRATLQALGRHWSTGYGVSATRWAAIVSRPALVSLRAEIGLRALLDPLPGELRLLVALHFVRRRPMEAIADRLRLSSAAANLLLFEALTAIGVRLGLPDASPTILQAGLVARFADDLILGRRPARFECAPTTLTALLAAAHVQAANPGNDLPDPRFVRRIADCFG
jgi:DNA-directed RNA polymerase specialized sigma24 family protein